MWEHECRTMATFGQELREERERRGLSLEILCAQTRVQQRYLTALEQDDYAALPGGVFRKGIVRAYLTAAGLAEEDWLPRFQQSFDEHARQAGGPVAPGTDDWAAFAENVRRNRVGTGRRSSVRWLGVLVLFLVLAAAAWAVWQFLLRNRLRAW